MSIKYSASDQNPKIVRLLANKSAKVTVVPHLLPDVLDAIEAKGGTVTQARAGGGKVRLWVTWPKRQKRRRRKKGRPDPGRNLHR
jgi:hypothetical protein